MQISFIKNTSDFTKTFCEAFVVEFYLKLMCRTCVGTLKLSYYALVKFNKL
jgi:hypothetical protein